MGKNTLFAKRIVKRSLAAVLASVIFVTTVSAQAAVNEPDAKENSVAVDKNDGLTVTDNLIGEYSFEGNAKNSVDKTGKDEAEIFGKILTPYNGTVKYTDGVRGKAVSFDGKYGFRLNKKNIGTDFTVSAWVKPSGTLPENMVMLFLGSNVPERWIGVSGHNGTSTVKIWGRGDNLTTWTTLFSPTISSGEWHHLVLTGTDGVLNSYLDGVKIGSDNRSNNPLAGEAQDIYLSLNFWDAQFKGLMDEVKIYNKCLTENQVVEEYKEMYVELAASEIELGNLDAVTENLQLPVSAENGVTISWSSSNPDVISESGIVTRTDKNVKVELTAIVERERISTERTFTATVIGTGAGAHIEYVKNTLTINEFIAQDIQLPTNGMFETDIEWSSEDEDIISGEGKIGSKRPAAGEGNATVTLTATISKGGVSDTKEFEVTVMEKAYGYIMGYVRGDNDRTGSLHLAHSEDGVTYKALNGNAGVLFAQIDTNDGTKNLSTGIRFAGTSLIRDKDGKFLLIAKQGGNNKVKYVYSSDNLLDYNLLEMVDDASGNNAEIESDYNNAQVSTSELTIPDGAKNASIIGVTKAEYENIIKRFAVVENTGVDKEFEDITVVNYTYLDEELPKTVTATYSDGSEAALNIMWDTDLIDMSEPGEYTLTGSIVEYSNPLIEQRADPHIKYDDRDNCYYFTASYPAFNNVNNGYDKIVLRKADSIQGLSDENGGLEKEITIWQAPESGKMAKHVWAPEIHRIKGKWYVFFAAGNSDGVWDIRPYILVCQNNEDPYNADSWKKDDGTYEIHAATSKDSRYFKNMSLDMTYFEQGGKHYVIWADIIGQSALYMQEINPDAPWEGVSEKVIMLTTPEFGWERDSERVNEGATIIKHDGKIFCAFSASGTGPEYCIGMLYADEDADLMNKDSWTKMGYPLLTSSDVPGEYGPGHNSFTVDPEGNPVFVYHARSEECYNNQCEWALVEPLYDPCRHARVKNVHWTEDGLPILKMSAEQEIPAEIRDVSIKVKVLNEAQKYLNDAKLTIENEQIEYEYNGMDICPEINVVYKGKTLVKDTDYYVEYFDNDKPGMAEVRAIAMNGSKYTGSQSATFKIVAAPNKVADYEMVSNDGETIVNKVNNGLNIGTQGLLPENFDTFGGVNLLTLNEDGYLTLPKGIIDSPMFTFSIVASTTQANNQWLVSIGKDSWNYCFFTPSNRSGNTKFSIAQQAPVTNATGAYGAEYNIEKASQGLDGSFHVYTAVVDGGVTALYVDGVKVGTGSNPYEIEKFADGADVLGYIGKSLYTDDPLFDGMVGEFIVYDGALTDTQVANEAAKIDISAYVKAAVATAMLNENEAADNIRANLAFPSKVAGVSVKWEVLEGGNYVAADGNVIRPGEADATAKVKATWLYNGNGEEEVFDLTIKKVTADELLESLVLPYGTAEKKEIYGNITLPEKLVNGFDITWTCDKPEIIDVESHENEGYDKTPAGTVTRPKSDTKVTLTAKINFNGEEKTKDFVATVKAAPEKIKDDDLTDYFFPYFIGEGISNGEQIYFAASEDGLNWTELNDEKPVLESAMGERGLRDPYIIRSAEGDKFYIIATDLKIYGNNDWNKAQRAGSQSLMVWESTDLINWSNQRMVEISASIDAGCTWAPEAMYDAVTGEYIVFWASKTAGDNYGKQRMYYAKTRDFYTFTEPEVYIDYQKSCIDTTMIEHDGKIYRYTKNEDGGYNEFGTPGKTIFIEKSDNGILGEFEHVQSQSLNSNTGVEGPAIFKFNSDDANTDTWCLLVDNYSNGGYYPLITTDLDKGVFTRPEVSYKMPNRARHGTPIRITREEYAALMEAMGGVQPSEPPAPPVPTPTPKPAPEETPTETPVQPTQVPGAVTQPTQIPGTLVQPTAGPLQENINYGKFFVSQSTVKSNSVKVKWNKVEGADGYVVYAALKGRKMKAVKTLAASKSSFTINKLKKGKYYGIKVCAYKTNADGAKNTVSETPVIYVATKGSKYANPVKITAKLKKKKIAVSKSTKITAKVSGKNVKKCVAKVRYISMNEEVATVSSKGVVKGIKAGKCKIYCIAQNGKTKVLTITVK